MENQSQTITPLSEEISKVDSNYKRILQFREAVCQEDKLTVRYNMRLAQAYKSNWKLTAQDESITDELNLYEETINSETTSIESYKEQVKCFKQENKELLGGRKDKIEEKVLYFEKKFHNVYNEYERKNLITIIHEIRNKTEKKRQDLNCVMQVQRNCREKINVILKNLSDEKVSTFVYDFISTEDGDALTEREHLKRIIKDLKLKWQQNEKTIQEFMNEKTRYNF